MKEGCKTKGKRNYGTEPKNCVLIDKVASHKGKGNNSKTTVHAH